MTDDEVDAIREEYRKSFIFPVGPASHKQFFLCPVGLPGAGKSTVVVPLSARFSLVRISSDEVRKLLKERGYNYDRLRDVIKPLVRDYNERGLSITFDADCSNPKTRELIESEAKKSGALVFWISINPPEEFILNKLRTLKHTWLFRDGEEAVRNYYTQKEKRMAEPHSFDFFAAVDTSRSDLPEQIEALGKEIERAVSAHLN